MIKMLVEGTRDTLYMTLFATFFGYLFGLPMGILLMVTVVLNNHDLIRRIRRLLHD